jgi:hypothetical protein
MTKTYRAIDSLKFDPTVIPFQSRVINDIAAYDYLKGTHEVFWNGKPVIVK